jgi:hypothetical protein
MNYGDAGLVPDGLDYQSVAPFIYLMLVTLSLVGHEASVTQYLSASPEAHGAVRDLSTAVAGAGVRVRNSGRVRNAYDVHMDLYTAEEFWLFDLAVDVIAMLVSMDDFGSDRRELLASDLETLDEHAHNHHWRKGVKKAGKGPARFHDLRAYVPHSPR